MSKTLKYLREGQDFDASHFEQGAAFTRPQIPQTFSKGGHVKPPRYKAGGAVLKNASVNPSTDPTSAKAKADNAAEANYRRSGGYGFKRGGDVKKMADGGFLGQIKSLAGSGVLGIAPLMLSQQMSQPAAAPAQAAAAPPAVQALGLRMGQKAGEHIAKQMGSKSGRRALGVPSIKEATGMAKGGPVKATVTKGVHQHEAAMHKGQKQTPLKLNMGGSVGGMQPITRLRSGGKVTC